MEAVSEAADVAAVPIEQKDENTELDRALRFTKEQLSQVFKEEEVLSELQSRIDDLATIGSTSVNMMIHCIGAYLSATLPQESLTELGKHLKNQIDEYLLEILKFNHSYSIHLSHNANQARLFALRTAIHYKYPLLKTEGSTCISRPPVFYGTNQYPLFRDNQPDERSRFAWELLQDQTSFNQIPGRVDENQDATRALPPLTIDVEILEEEIERDLAKGRLPCAVLASHLDDLEGIRQLCDRHRIWLHVEGGSSSLLLAAGTRVPSCTKKLLDCANSISAQPFDWWKVEHPSQQQQDVASTQVVTSATVTFLRIDRQYEASVFPVAASDVSLLFSLSHRFALQDSNQMTARVDHSLTICDHLRHQLESHSDLFSITIGPDPDLLPHVLLFQILPNSDRVDLTHFNLDDNALHLIIKDHVEPSLINDLALTQITYQGVTCFMFQPLKIPNVDSLVSLENINQFVDSVCHQIKLLEGAVQARSMFEEYLSAHTDLEPVPYQEVKSFVGIGAFRFIPEVLSNEKAISSLNHALAESLMEKSPIYRLSECQDGMSCIVITISDDLGDNEFIANLVDDICNATEHLTFPQDVLDNMSVAIKEGINTAEHKMQEHSAEAYRPDNLIRKIPVFGSMYGWMFPTDPKVEDLGHTYDIRSHRLSAPQIEVIKSQERANGGQPDIKDSAESEPDGQQQQGENEHPADIAGGAGGDGVVANTDPEIDESGDQQGVTNLPPSPTEYFVENVEEENDIGVQLQATNSAVVDEKESPNDELNGGNIQVEASENFEENALRAVD